MMSKVFAQLRSVAFGLGVLAAGSVVEASVLSLKAVKKNNVAITRTNNLAVLGGDTIEAEIFLSGWLNDFPPPTPPNPPGVRTFQARLVRSGFESPDNGTALPLHWCAPVDRIDCETSATCPPAYPICSPALACTCTGHNPALDAFITTSRSDYLFSGLGGFTAIDTSSLGIRYFGLAEDTAVPDTGVLRYLGTLILEVSANACGTFTIGFVDELLSTFIADMATVSSLPTLEPLRLTVSDCVRQLVSCNPLSSSGLPEGSHCAEDARIPHDRLAALQRHNWNTIQMTFSKPAAGMLPTDFEVTLIPVVQGDFVPAISTVTPNGNNATLALNRRIQVMRWTCIRDKGSNKRCCVGSLPGDADNSRISQLADTFEVLDNLSGGVDPALAIEKCDIDRSLQCSPADLLMVVDLLNGADAFIEVNGDTLPVLSTDVRYNCPSMRLP